MPKAIANQNAEALLINGFWILVAYLALQSKPLNLAVSGRLSAISFVMIVLFCALFPGWSTSERMLHCCGLLAIWLFVLGFFGYTQGQIENKTFLPMNMIANAMIAPILYSNGNYPQFSIQIVCFIGGSLGLLRLSLESRAQRKALNASQ